MQFSHGFYIKVLAASQDQFIFLRFVFFISEMDKNVFESNKAFRWGTHREEKTRKNALSRYFIEKWKFKKKYVSYMHGNEIIHVYG